MSSCTERRLYPWQKETPLNEGERLDFDIVDENLFKLGFPLNTEKPNSSFLIEKFDAIMDYLDVNRGGLGKWLIIASNNPEWLTFLGLAIPISYARSFKRSVHPINSNDLLLALQKPNMIVTQNIVPFGFEGLCDSRLVVFSRINSPAKYIRDYMSTVEGMFDQWAFNGTSVIALVNYTTRFNPDAVKQLMLTFSTNYGPSVSSHFITRARTLVLHDSRMLEAPLAWGS